MVMGSQWPRIFPDPKKAPADAPLAVGGPLSVEMLLSAYAQGIFPWYSEGEPVYWWSPDPRMILPLADYHCPHGLKRVLKKGEWEITFDTDFMEVAKCCATVKRRGQKGTWITSEMIRAYGELHRKGFAHSVECWQQGRLAGGLYGISLGNIFFGESMFQHVSNASKVALHSLAGRLKDWNFSFIDCQLPTSHLATFGACPWPREKFLHALETGLKYPIRKGSWKTSPQAPTLKPFN